MNRVSFQVERTREVGNDLVRAVVGLTDEDASSAALADRINQAMTWALGRAKQKAGIDVESGSYHTFPVHEKGRIRRWRASQDLVIEGRDPGAVGELVADLQSRLQLRSIDFQVSPERRLEVEEGLVVEALAAFRTRAELVRESLDASSYALVAVDVQTGGGARPVRYRQAEAMVVDSTVAPPALEAGTSRLTVHVNGTIELD